MVLNALEDISYQSFLMKKQIILIALHLDANTAFSKFAIIYASNNGPL